YLQIPLSVRSATMLDRDAFQMAVSLLRPISFREMRAADRGMNVTKRKKAHNTGGRFSIRISTTARLQTDLQKMTFPLKKIFRMFPQSVVLTGVIPVMRPTAGLLRSEIGLAYGA